MSYLLATVDFLLWVIHILVILVNTLGWAWRPLARIQRVILGITLLSWTLGGWFYGWGYCFLTDWHWQVKEMRGELDLPLSFVSYLLYPIQGAYLPTAKADLLVALATVVGVVGAAWRWRREGS